MNMPIMGGSETLDKIREIDNSIPVIISSGFTRDSDMESLNDKGISGFINKPFRRVEISKIVADILTLRNFD